MEPLISMVKLWKVILTKWEGWFNLRLLFWCVRDTWALCRCMWSASLASGEARSLAVGPGGAAPEITGSCAGSAINERSRWLLHFSGTGFLHPQGYTAATDTGNVPVHVPQHSSLNESLTIYDTNILDSSHCSSINKICITGSLGGMLMRMCWMPIIYR